MMWVLRKNVEDRTEADLEMIGSSRVLVESNAEMYHLSALNSLWRIYRIEDKARE
jgi:hypothetical protein